MKKIICCILFSWCSVGICDDAKDALQTRLKAMHTMTAKFNQVVYAKKRELSRSSGLMALERPGHFRWQTEQPMPQWVIADGKYLWVYDLDLEQVTVKKQDKNLGSTAALFLNHFDDTLTKDFTVSVHTENNAVCFDLQAKSSKANFQRMTLTFKGSELVGIGLFDQLGQYTDIHLTHIKTNIAVEKTLFQFKPPKGVDVVEQ